MSFGVVGYIFKLFFLDVISEVISYVFNGDIWLLFEVDLIDVVINDE